MNRAYYGWLAGSTLSVFGDTALYFALGWAATGIGPHVAGLVLTGFTLPRAVLLLLGGVLGDRVGPRRLLLTCSAAVGTACFILAAVTTRGTSTTVLLATAAVVGTIDAFALPAAGVLPRLFVPADDLPKAMALRTSATQIITLAGGPISGLLVTTIGLPGTLLIDATTFTIQFAVLLLLKPPYDAPPDPDPRPLDRATHPAHQAADAEGADRACRITRAVRAHRAVRADRTARADHTDGAARAERPTRAGRFVGEVVDGVRVAWGDPVLRLVLGVVGVVAAFVLPVTSLCVPLIGRTNGWTAGHTGLVVGGSVAGSLLVTVVVARLGTYRRPGHAAALGCLLAAVGITGLAIAPSVAATVVQGLGVGLFTSHLAPVFVRSTPRSHLTRLQSLLSLVQTVPLIASTNLLASLNLTHALTLSATATTCAAVPLLRLEPAHVYFGNSSSKEG